MSAQSLKLFLIINEKSFEVFETSIMGVESHARLMEIISNQTVEKQRVDNALGYKISQATQT